MKVIDPNSTYLRIWEMILAFFIIAVLFFVPVEWVMTRRFNEPEMYGRKWFVFMLFSIVIFGLNMVVSLNTGFYEKGQKIMDRW